MINKTKKILIICSVSAAFFLNSCKSDKNENQKANLQIPPQEEILQSYFSEKSPGKWNDLPDNHSPDVVIKHDKNSTTITVKPVFEIHPDHYVEFLMLTDYQVKELQKQEFTRSTIKPMAVFILPKNARGTYYILLKCNLHDTWYKKIIF